MESVAASGGLSIQNDEKWVAFQNVMFSDNNSNFSLLNLIDHTYPL